MLGITLLVFREVLEAALIVSIVAAATRGVLRRGGYISAGIALGISGAILVALFAGRIATLASGLGQELFNASVLLAAVVMIGWHVVWMSSHGRELAKQMQTVGHSVQAGSSSMALLFGVVALAVLREGSEVVLFLYGLMAGGANNVWLGLGLGLAGGAAVGMLMYFGLLRIPMRHFFAVTNWMLVILAGGLAATAAGYLLQADWLPAFGNQLWNSSALLSERSLSGQTLHILVGYTDRPAGVQLLAWGFTVMVLVVGMRWMSRPRLLAVPATSSAEGAVLQD